MIDSWTLGKVKKPGSRGLGDGVFCGTRFGERVSVRFASWGSAVV